jgi:hypothetical protein
LINDNKSRKPAADYLRQVNNLLGAYTYKETLNSDPLVDRYELTGNGQTRQAYMLVVPDERGRTATYDLSVGSGMSVKLYTPKIGSDEMIVMTLLPGSTGKVRVSVSETPVFVLATPVSGARTAAEVVEPALGSLQVFPNPTTDYVELTIDNGDTSPVTARLYDASTGRVHKQAEFEKPAQQLRERIDISALPTGMYLLDIRQGTERAVRKVIKVQ